MTQQLFVTEVVNFQIPGKEQFYSYQHNINYQLLKSTDKFIYVKLDFIEMNVYVHTETKKLTLIESEFLLKRYSNFDYIITDSIGPCCIELESPMFVQSNVELLKYDWVIVAL